MELVRVSSASEIWSLIILCSAITYFLMLTYLLISYVSHIALLLFIRSYLLAREGFS